MGWIDDLAKERGHSSLRALAHAMRDSAAWPSSDERSAETVANKLRDLNKGKDAGWWTGTGKSLLPALAEALQEDQEDLVERLLRGSVVPGPQAVRRDVQRVGEIGVPTTHRVGQLGGYRRQHRPALWAARRAGSLDRDSISVGLRRLVPAGDEQGQQHDRGGTATKIEGGLPVAHGHPV